MFYKTMVRWLTGVALAAVIFAGTTTQAFAQDYTPLDFSSQANFTWSGEESGFSGITPGVYLPGSPTGPTTLGGVPFNITSNSEGYQAWNGFVAGGFGNSQLTLTIPADVYGVTNVFTLINTWWGEPGPTSYASLVFTATDGSTYTDNLIGGVDIRDYNNDVHTNTINGSSTVNVFNCPIDEAGYPGRLDMQDIVLPAAFSSKTLGTIQLVDNGQIDLQRVVLDGVTVESVPELSTFALLGMGVLGLGVVSLRRGRARATLPGS